MMFISTTIVCLFSIFALVFRAFDGKVLGSSAEAINSYEGEELGTEFMLMSAPANSFCSGAQKGIPLDNLPFNTAVSNSGPSQNCYSVSETLWYYYVAQASGELKLITEYDLVIAVYESETCPQDLTVTKACALTAYINFQVTEGKKYYFS